MAETRAAKKAAKTANQPVKNSGVEAAVRAKIAAMPAAWRAMSERLHALIPPSVADRRIGKSPTPVDCRALPRIGCTHAPPLAGIFRFPSEVSAYVQGVSDRAGLGRTSRYRCRRWRLPLLLTASATRSKALSRLNTRPARSTVNASVLPLRTAPPVSELMRVATSQSRDFCIHYTSPV
jgi:hypothetical protein